MSLKSRKFILKDVRFSFEGHPISFIPEVVGDKEVYSIANQNNEHCGYMTEDMLNTILKMNGKEDIENNIIRNSLFVDANNEKEEPTTLAQKIIIDEFKGATLLNIELYPVKYEEHARPLVMKVEGEYSVKNSGKKLSLDFVNQETISCNNFTFFNKVPTDVNININSGSSTFEDIRFFHLENSPGKDHEINLYLRSRMMDSISVADLTFNGLSEGTKGAYYLAFEANGSSLRAEKMKIKLPAAPQTEGKYCRLSSLKKNMKIYKSNLTFLEPGSFLEVRKNIDLTGVDLFINGENKVDGNLKFNGDAKHYGTLKIRNLKSYSSLHFNTRNCGIFNLADSTLNNGKKNIIFKRGDTHLAHVNIENEGRSDLILDKVKIGNSKLTNISDLHDSEIINAEVSNFILKTKNPVANRMIFSFGSLEALCSLKNSVVNLNETDSFQNDTSGALHLNNSIVEGTTVIGTSKDNGSHSLTINNSNLKDAQISLTREDDSGKDFTTTISNSEISMFFNASGLKSVQNSIITDCIFTQIYEINDSICKSVSLDGKGNNILNGYNSINHEDKPSIGQATDDFELL